MRPGLKQHEDYFETDGVILHRNQMTKTVPDLAPHPPNFHVIPVRGRLTLNNRSHTADLCWKRVSNWKHFDPHSETLRPGQSG
ncbi:hypothetical protein AVEN_126064-1, partial [Araneus ventricosus]